MQILQLLAEKESVVLKKWLDLVLNEYPNGAVNFLKTKTDRFANPLGHNFSVGLKRLYESIKGDGKEDVSSHLEQLMKLRAVQTEHSPSEALGFIFAVKKVIREECRKEWSSEIEGDWREIEGRVDKLALQAFDLYMASRERLFKVRLRELQTGNHIITDNMKCPSAVLREDKELQKQKNER